MKTTANRIVEEKRGDRPVLTVVKIGGNVIDDVDALLRFSTDFSQLPGPKILVHGGGKRATEMSASLGVKTTMIRGRRVTDARALEVVVMVYAGLLNKQLVSGLQALGCQALGLTGADGNAILAHKRIVRDVDYGLVGDVDRVNSGFISSLLEQGVVPVFCAVTHDGKGQLLNTNADTIASVLAQSLASIYRVKLVYCFEKAGVLTDINDEDSVIEHMDKERYGTLMQKGIIAEGMLPKLKNCFEALESGVEQVILGKPDLLGDRGHKHTEISL